MAEWSEEARRNIRASLEIVPENHGKAFPLLYPERLARRVSFFWSPGDMQRGLKLNSGMFLWRFVSGMVYIHGKYRSAGLGIMWPASSYPKRMKT